LARVWKSSRSIRVAICFRPRALGVPQGSRSDPLGIPLLLGREITERDQPSSNRVCLINEAFAKRFFVPVAQPIDVPNFVNFAARTAAEPSSVIAGVRRAILSEDPNLPIPVARAMDELIDERMVQDRLLARLSMAFGVVALLPAAIGLYGVLSYGVARRTSEIGIRKALGAQHGAVMAMILRETGLLLVVGLVAGVALSAAGMRLITSRLYGLAPTDPVALGAAIALRHE
jgi:hypothetical protein